MSQCVRQLHEKFVGTGKLQIVAACAVRVAHEFLNVWRCFLFSANPVQGVVIALVLLDKLEKWIVVTAVPTHNPGAPLTSMLKERFNDLPMLSQFVRIVQQRKAVALPVQMKHRLVGQLFKPHRRRHGQIVDRWKFVEHCAALRDQRIEVGGEQAINIPVRDQRPITHMSPVQASFVDIATNQIPLRARIKFGHAIAVRWKRWRRVAPMRSIERSLVHARKLRFDVTNNVRCKRNTGCLRAARAY